MPRITCVTFVALLVSGALPAVAQRARTTTPAEARADVLDDCSDRRRGGWDRETFCEVRELRLASVKQLALDGNQNGGVRVHGWDRSEIVGLAQVQSSGDTMDEARALAARISIDSAVGHVSAEGPSNRRGNSWAVSFEAFVPRQTDLHASTYNGGIEADNLNGRLELSAVNGGIHLAQVSGDVRGETTNGPVVAELDGDRWTGTGLDLRTTNGPVNLSIPKGYSARLETGTQNGGMRIDFPVTLQGEIGRRIRTQLGSGGAMVRAVTTNGPVTIRER